MRHFRVSCGGFYRVKSVGQHSLYPGKRLIGIYISFKVLRPVSHALDISQHNNQSSLKQDSLANKVFLKRLGGKAIVIVLSVTARPAVQRSIVVTEAVEADSVFRLDEFLTIWTRLISPSTIDHTGWYGTNRAGH